MNESEEKRFEESLRGIQPAPTPEQFMLRLLSVQPEARLRLEKAAPRSTGFRWTGLLRWAVPVAATGAVVAGIWRANLPPSRSLAVPPALRVNDVHINSDLVSAFDAVGWTPSGEPVRYRCQEWVDEVEMRDTQKGLVVQRSAPRFEVVAVGYEVY
jgi:hypothetical protein